MSFGEADTRAKLIDPTRVQKKRNIVSVARDLDTIEKIRSLKRARESGRK
jgi:hypothetical protein